MSQTIIIPRAACVIGWPVAHSRSPLIHRYWLAQHGIAGDYRREAVRPEALEDFVNHLAERGYVGANTTIPHKEAVLRLAEPDKDANAVGAANTLWLADGKLRATNTDVEGFLCNLDDRAPGWDSNLDTALVLGAGGAARAVLFGLIRRGVGRILLVNRTLATAQLLRERFGDTIVPIEWSALPDAMAQSALLVNTTSLGMTGQPELSLDLAPLPQHAVVNDLVYAPLRTGLLTAAQECGLRSADGLGMLLHQAVRGFTLWFGVTPKVTPELRTLVERDLVAD